MSEEIKEASGEPEEQIEITSYLDDKADIRSDIETAMAVYNFLEEIDVESAKVLTFGLKDDLIETMKDCLIIVKASVKLLVVDSGE